MLENLSFDLLKSKFNSDKKFKLGTYFVGGIVGLGLVFLLYRQFMWLPDNEKSNDGWWIAMNYISKDSTDQAIKALEPFVRNYDGKSGGEIGQYLLATQYMKKGQFKKALDNLENVDLDDTYLRVFSTGLQGDCLSEMKKYDEAEHKYFEAAEMEDNEFTSPMYLFKAGLCAEKLKKFDKATEYYTSIQDNYPTFASQKSIEKFLSRSSNNIVK
jgi:tetratricopeptide (TPR) repeat protein